MPVEVTKTLQRNKIRRSVQETEAVYTHPYTTTRTSTYASAEEENDHQARHTVHNNHGKDHNSDGRRYNSNRGTGIEVSVNRRKPLASKNANAGTPFNAYDGIVHTIKNVRDSAPQQASVQAGRLDGGRQEEYFRAHKRQKQKLKQRRIEQAKASARLSTAKPSALASAPSASSESASSSTSSTAAIISTHTHVNTVAGTTTTLTCASKREEEDTKIQAYLAALSPYLLVPFIPTQHKRIYRFGSRKVRVAYSNPTDAKHSRAKRRAKDKDKENENAGTSVSANANATAIAGHGKHRDRGEGLGTDLSDGTGAYTSKASTGSAHGDANASADSQPRNEVGGGAGGGGGGEGVLVRVGGGYMPLHRFLHRFQPLEIRSMYSSTAHTATNTDKTGTTHTATTAGPGANEIVGAQKEHLLQLVIQQQQLVSTQVNGRVWGTACTRCTVNLPALGSIHSNAHRTRHH